MRPFVRTTLILVIAGAIFYALPRNPPTAPEAGPIKVDGARTDDSKAAALAARNGYLGKPLTLVGKTIDGKDFSTASLKGKVALVHFWASWCPDCHAELPSVIKLYETYHAKGLEIVGISSDVTAADLRDYLAKHAEIPWTQLYTPPDSNGRHPLNTTYNVDWMPSVFIIDQEGVLRSVTGYKDMDELVPKLLKL